MLHRAVRTFPLLAAVALFSCTHGDLAAPAASPSMSAGRSRTTEASSCTFERSKRVMRLVADCTTDQTIWVPDEMTLNGDGHTITAVDPAGGHFIGAIVENAGATANVRDLRLTASIANVCDDADARLAGIRFTDASGTISGNVLAGVTQRYADGSVSGCQEGFSIWVRSRSWTGPSFDVVIDENSVSDYLKEGIFASGNVGARITDNVVRGSGPQSGQAQYGIEVTTSAPGRVERNRIFDNVYTGAYPAFAGGINSDSASGLVVSNNEIVRSSAGIQLFANRNAHVVNNSVTGDRGTPCPAFSGPGQPCRFGVQISGSDDRITANRFAVLDVGIDILQPARRITLSGNKFRDVDLEVRGSAAP